MDLGTFSVSLSVKDLASTRSFYEKLGFAVFHDASEQHYRAALDACLKDENVDGVLVLLAPLAVFLPRAALAGSPAPSDCPTSTAVAWEKPRAIM